MRLRFGLFVSSIHSVNDSPTYSLHSDVRLACLGDRLGYDEVWFGEHHTLGTQLIGSPEVFIGYVAAKTSRIRLGTGAITLPYHNPVWVADRMVLLDHLTRGRVMCGVGPGSAPSDADMIGLDASVLRPALEEDLPIFMHLLTEDEPISVVTDRYELREARLQMRPYQDPCFEIAVPAVASAIGPTMAGRTGASLLSIASNTPQGFEALGNHWSIVVDEAAKAGQPEPNRSMWRLTGIMHIAETKEQAFEDIRFGFMEWFDHFQKNTSHPGFALTGTSYEERLEFLLENKMAVIGTPDDAVAEIESFVDRSGGFGCFLQFDHDMVNWEAKERHHELFARYVMPRFQGQFDRTQAMQATMRSRQSKDKAAYGAALDRYAGDGSGAASR